MGIGAVAPLARLGVRRLSVYLVLGSLVWLAFPDSGILATIAGVLLGFMTPARRHIGEHSRPKLRRSRHPIPRPVASGRPLSDRVRCEVEVSSARSSTVR
ncbi:MAG: Na+/H+ antiporter NhaA [Deltaproteobacteria bacterium]|nr:Na+/H+ antiporter NhaA [Deltaproteobacteria bacterium]